MHTEEEKKKIKTSKKKNGCEWKAKKNGKIAPHRTKDL